MRRAVIRMTVALMLIVAGLGTAGRHAAAQAKVDITGAWAFDVTTDAGTGNSTVTFKQDGEKLSGHYSGSTLGEAELTGTVKGQAVNFSFTANVQGNALDVAYMGTVESKDAMKGSLTITAIGNGTFTAKRK